MKITQENFREAQYDVFLKFHQQLALVTAGTPEDFNTMTIGWGAMGNVWGHPGSAITVYVSPDRYTFEYLEKTDYFSVCFFPEEYKKDVTLLGAKSGRDGDKVALTRLTPKPLTHTVGFEQAELTFECKKIYMDQFKLDKVPDFMRDGVYQKLSPHYIFIGAVEDAFGEV